MTEKNKKQNRKLTVIKNNINYNTGPKKSPEHLFSKNLPSAHVQIISVFLLSLDR